MTSRSATPFTTIIAEPNTVLLGGARLAIAPDEFGQALAASPNSNYGLEGTMALAAGPTWHTFSADSFREINSWPKNTNARTLDRHINDLHPTENTPVKSARSVT